MENNQEITFNTIEGLFKNPSQIADILTDPRKHGVDYYNGMSNKQKQYVLLAAGLGLIIYGIYLGRQEDHT